MLFLMFLSWSNSFSVVMPLRRARVELFCIVGPSAKGSLKGKPISTMSTPLSCKAQTMGSVSSNSGCPAEKYMDSNLCSFWKVLSISLFRGLFSGLGWVLGATILVSLLTYTLSQIEFIPILGEWVSQLINEIESFDR